MNLNDLAYLLYMDACDREYEEEHRKVNVENEEDLVAEQGSIDQKKE